MRVRLADFIAENVEPILVEWEAFARGIWPKGVHAEPAELRDSAEQILRAVVADMGTAQSPAQQSAKSMGHGGAGGDESDRLEHASQVHGAGRVGSGMALHAVVAEYRALRASVLRLWRAANPQPDVHDLDDITRFNEAIDQSLALAVAALTDRIAAARAMFLAILGHDLRNPLAAISLTAKLAQGDVPPANVQVQDQLRLIGDSARQIGELITDLIDFASVAIGRGMPVAPAATDLSGLCDAVLRETRAAHPRHAFQRTFRGNLAGTWDPHRLRQMIANLLANAVRHGSPTQAVTLTADGSADDHVTLAVHNAGQPIPPDLLPAIFDPLVRGPTPAAADTGRNVTPTGGSIGLGLYIVREIATGHGGDVTLTSTAKDGTTATVRLPRHAPGKRGQ